MMIFAILAAEPRPSGGKMTAATPFRQYLWCFDSSARRNAG
jgi:hypothetical protein